MTDNPIPPHLLLQSCFRAVCSMSRLHFCLLQRPLTARNQPWSSVTVKPETEAEGPGPHRIQTHIAGPQALLHPHFVRHASTHTFDSHPPPHPRGTTMLWPQTRTLKRRAVKTKVRVSRTYKVSDSDSSSNPSSSLPHAKAASFPIINAIKKGRGRGVESGGERKGGEPPPQPAAGSFLVRGKASNEGPSMPLSWRCQPGSPAELRAAHLCPQLAHRSSIKACACCQRQRPQGRPFQQWEEAKALWQALASAPCLLVGGGGA